MVRLSLTLNGSERTSRDLGDALRSLAMATRLDRACLGCHVWLEDDGETSLVHYDEAWASEPDMRRRVRSDRFRSLLALIESSREAPDVRFDFVTTTRGLDYVAEVRGADV
jgi:hypothetical protein